MLRQHDTAAPSQCTRARETDIIVLSLRELTMSYSTLQCLRSLDREEPGNGLRMLSLLGEKLGKSSRAFPEMKGYDVLGVIERSSSFSELFGSSNKKADL